MKTQCLTSQLFAQTTVNVGDLQAYLRSIPCYYESALLGEVSERTLKQLNQMDQFEFAFRHYLAGRCKNLRRVNEQIRQFEQVEGFGAWHLIAYDLEVIRQCLLCFEAYELLPRFQYARQRIESQFEVDLDWCLNGADPKIYPRQQPL